MGGDEDRCWELGTGGGTGGLKAATKGRLGVTSSSRVPEGASGHQAPQLTSSQGKSFIFYYELDFT